MPDPSRVARIPQPPPASVMRPAASTRGRAATWALARDVAREHRAVGVACLAYAAAWIAVNAWLPLPNPWAVIMWSQHAIIFGACLILAIAFDAAARGRRAIRDTLEPRRIAGFLLVVLVAPPFLATFVSFKHAIPHLHPFALDAFMASLDRALHGGVDPWRLLVPLLRSERAVRVIDSVYASWFFVFPAALAFLAWSRDRQTRAQFLLAFTLTWSVAGTGFATLLSSAGPCYYRLVSVGPDPFGALLSRLYDLDAGRRLIAVTIQDRLWRSHAAGDWSTITAMPSMHVALAALLVPAARRIGPFLFAASMLYLALICVGSVALGWHYAVDGYVAIAVTWGLWWTAGRIVERLTRRGSR